MYPSFFFLIYRYYNFSDVLLMLCQTKSLYFFNQRNFMCNTLVLSFFFNHLYIFVIGYYKKDTCPQFSVHDNYSSTSEMLCNGFIKIWDICNDLFKNTKNKDLIRLYLTAFKANPSYSSQMLIRWIKICRRKAAWQKVMWFYQSNMSHLWNT